MGLHIKNELEAPQMIGERFRFKQLDVQHIEEPASHQIHSQKRGGYASGCFQKVPTAAPDSNRRMPSECRDNGLHKGLLPSLRRKNEFLVRRDPSQRRSE